MKQLGVLAAPAAILILVAIGAGGWPGAVSGCVAAGDCSCEAVRSGLIAQPSNTGSSLFLVVAGLVVLLIGPISPEVDTGAAMRRIHATLLGGAILLAGLGSVAFHASMTEWGGWTDLLGVAAVLTFAAAYRLLARQSDAAFLVSYGVAVGSVGVCLWLVGTDNGKWILASLGVLAIGLESVAARRGDRSLIEWRWLGAAAVVFASGGVVWWFSREGYPLCSPVRVWQWHGIWHMLAAIAIVCVSMFWRSELRIDTSR